jgi:hypothetical protein
VLSVDSTEKAEISELGRLAIDELLKTSRETSEEFRNKIVPSQLFHFTGAGGVIGILKDECLWASRAMCLNDASEVLYGIRLVSDYLGRTAESQPPKRKAFRMRAQAYLDPSKVEPALRVHADPFVVSFSETDRDSFHCLHYGRGGDGYSLGFEASKLAVTPFELQKVEYDPRRQREIVERAVNRLEEAFLDLANRQEERDVARIGETAAIVFAATMWNIAAWLKHPSFRGEDEWRLITFDIRGEHIDTRVGVQLPTKFRAEGNRIVPYIEVQYAGSGDRLPLSSVKVGSRVERVVAEDSIRHLLRERHYNESITIGAADVPLR